MGDLAIYRCFSFDDVVVTSIRQWNGWSSNARKMVDMTIVKCSGPPIFVDMIWYVRCRCGHSAQAVSVANIK
jgi:hypothetical protein